MSITKQSPCTAIESVVSRRHMVDTFIPAGRVFTPDSRKAFLETLQQQVKVELAEQVVARMRALLERFIG